MALDEYERLLLPWRPGEPRYRREFSGRKPGLPFLVMDRLTPPGPSVLAYCESETDCNLIVHTLNAALGLPDRLPPEALANEIE